MDSNGRESPDVKNSNRSRSRSPIGGDDRHSSRGRTRNRSRDRQTGGNRRNASIACRRVYIANIPFDAKWTDVKDLFKEKIGDVAYVQLFEDETGKFRGCGVVELKEASSVAKAIDVLHRYEFRGRKLVIKEDYDLERDKSGRLIPGTGGSGSSRDRNRERPRDGYGRGNSDMGSFNTYGLSPQFLDSLGINGPLSSKVFIANLDFKVTSKKLSEVFKLAGKIVNIDLKVDSEGNSKGHGIVEFEHPVEAVQAISMFNGQKLFQRLMSVRMDRYDGEEDPRASKLPSGLSGLGKGLGANGQAIHLAGMSGGVGGLPSASLGMMGGAGFGINPVAAAAAAMSAGMGAAGLGAMGLGGGLGAGLASGLGSGLGAAGLTGGAGLTAGLGLGLGNSNLGSATERGLLGSSLGGGLGSGLSLGNSSSLGLGSGGASGLNFGLGGGSSNAGSGGLMSGHGGSGLSSLGNSSALVAAMSNSGASLGGSSGAYGDYGSAYDRGTQGGGVNSNVSGDNFGSTSSDTVQVRNLPANYSWQNLRDRFRDVGDVRYTELKARGTAFIRFNSERDAQRAVDLMNGIRIEGRPIEVRLY